MNRPVRIAFEVLGPPSVGLLLFFVPKIPDLIASIWYGHTSVTQYLFIVVVAYIIVGVPSVAYALAMEVAFSRYIRPNSWRAVALSSVLGFVCGLVLGVFANAMDTGRDGEPHFIR